MAFNQSEISLPRGERGGKILVTASVGSSGEGLTEKIQFFFRSNGNKILAAIQKSENKLLDMQIIKRRNVLIHDFTSALGRGLSFPYLPVGEFNSITLLFGLIQNKTQFFFGLVDASNIAQI